MNSHGTFVTVLGCMDGRCQEKTIAFAKKMFAADHVDTITEPGMDKVLAGGDHVAAQDQFLPALREWVKAKARISAEGHGSKSIIITGHVGCAGNPVEYNEHLENLEAAADLVRSWGFFDNIRIAAFGEDWDLKAVGLHTEEANVTPAKGTSAKKVAL